MGTKYEPCPNCGAAITCEEDLRRVWPDIPDLVERVAPGESVPAGECGKCGALVHELRAPRVMDSLGELVAACNADIHTDAPECAVAVARVEKAVMEECVES